MQYGKGSNILATIYAYQWVQALQLGTWFCALKFKQLNPIWILHLFLVDMQWYTRISSYITKR